MACNPLIFSCPKTFLRNDEHELQRLITLQQHSMSEDFRVLWRWTQWKISVSLEMRVLSAWKFQVFNMIQRECKPCSISFRISVYWECLRAMQSRSAMWGSNKIYWFDGYCFFTEIFKFRKEFLYFSISLFQRHRGVVSVGVLTNRMI